MKSWAVPAAIIVAVEYLFALLIGARVGFHYRIPFVAYAIIGTTIAAAGVVVFILGRLIRYAAGRERRPARRLMAELPKCLPFLAGTLLVSLEIGVLTWTKIMLPIAVPFWADPFLADFDHGIFHAEPWRIAHDLFGWADPLVDRAYITWAPIKFGTLIVVLAMPESAVKARALVAYFAMMAMATMGQYLLSSGGPVFYAQLGFGDRFASLPIEQWVESTTQYLWRNYERAGGDIGGGISAMPSLHVAVALWVALVTRSYWPRLAVAGFFYFALIVVGSVLLGWHYAVDGIVGVAITLVAWRVAAVPTRERATEPGSLPLDAIPTSTPKN
ncbi:MAG TPA: phosphatase PAP2 family protein [Sphingomicrobium sp.]|jgi:hypothetical protein|nr:phosphatase PAP2 family protein [Sphingomicrobium sp.]